jgi:Tol biopolymer transport system component
MTQLATGDVREPVWSPDGSKIVFVHGSTFGEIRRGIFVMNADGSGQTRLKDAPPTSSFGMAWSPDGAKIAFTAGTGIFLINADGIGLIQLTLPGQIAQSPTWSPDGSKIAFSLTEATETAIYVMNADGSGQTRITDESLAQTWVPAWSPNGSKIAFAGPPRSGGVFPVPVIYIMNVDGSELTQVTTSYSTNPAWSPDGSRIVFNDREDLWLINPDGSGLTQITTDDRRINKFSDAAWSPR